jgi:hypothetical protein
MLKLGQQWPDDAEDNKYWIGATVFDNPQHSDGLVFLGRECRSLAELKNLAAEIRVELDRVIEEARRKLEPNPHPRASRLL